MKNQGFLVFFVAAVFLVLVVFSPFISHQNLTLQAQYRNTITGHVFDPQRKPVGQIHVELMDEVYRVIQRTRTDGSGRFLFVGLSAGRFIIRVLPLGTNLEEQSQEIEIINFVRPGSQTSENAQKDFYLRVRRDSNNPSVTGTIFAQEVPDEARKKYEKAVVDLDDKKTEEGIVGLQAALKIFPDYYSALERLGRVYIINQKYIEAKEAFSKAVAINDRGFFSWYGLSFANYALKSSNEAVEAAEKAVALNGNSVDALLLLGISQRQAQRFESSEKTLKQAVKISNKTSQKTPDIHWNLALLYAHNLKRYKDAADQLELYLKAAPAVPNAENIRKLIKHYREKAAEAN